MEPFQTMWEYMSGPERELIMMGSNTEGIEKVIETDGKYAFMMESSSIQYIIERNCLVTQIGGNLDNKGYGIAMALGTPYKPLIDSAILNLLEGGVLHKLRIKWWKQKRGGGACTGGGGGGAVSALGLDSVLGCFLATFLGIFVGILIALCEFLHGTKKQSEEMGTSWVQEMREELRFAFLCYGSSKAVRKPPKTSSAGSISKKSDADSESIHSTTSSSSKSSSTSSSSSSSHHRKRAPKMIPNNAHLSKIESKQHNHRGKKSLPPSPPPPPMPPSRSTHSPSPNPSSNENPYARSGAPSSIHSPYGESGYGRNGAKSPSSHTYGRGGKNPFED